MLSPSILILALVLILHSSHAMTDTPDHKLSYDKDLEPASGVATPGSRSPDNVHGTDRNSIDREDPNQDQIDLEKVETARDQDRPGKTTPASAVNRILSKVKSTASTVDPGPPPNGGWHAWTIALSGHATICATWGFVNSFVRQPIPAPASSELALVTTRDREHFNLTILRRSMCLHPKYHG